MFQFRFLLGAVVAAGLCVSGVAQVNVLTFHNDNARTGANLNETILTPTNVKSATFGKLFTYTVDGYVYAQPLYVSGLAIPGQGTHNAVFVATEHNSVYCFDADSNTGTNGGVLWQVNLGPSAPCPVDGFRFEAIQPEVGITGTPVIDPTSQTLYVDAFTFENGTYIHRIHALNLTDGSEKPFSPVVVNVSVPGNGAGSSGGVLPFQAIQELQRSALTLAGGVLYVAYAGYTDTTLTDPFHGWLIGFDPGNLQVLPNHIFNSTPNGTSDQFGALAGEGGIWMGNGGLAVDANTNLYFATGDGNFNAFSGGTEYGDSIIKLSTANGFSVTDYFTPYNQQYFRTNDIDVGSGGVMLLPDQPGPYPHLMVAGGKPQFTYLLNRDQMTTDNHHYNSGGSSDNILQSLYVGGGIFSTPSYYNGSIYYIAGRSPIRSYVVTNGTLIPDLPGTIGTRTFPFPGATVSISANGATNGIAWATRNTNSGPGILVAWNATNVSTELYNSTQSGTRDQLPNPVKFTAPTIANGKVYVGSQYALSVFGLLGGALQFDSTNYTTSQTNASVTITVNRVGGSTGAVQVDYATTPGTAIVGQDYIATSGTLSWSSGDTNSKTFSVSILNNSPSGTNKTIFLTLSNATDGSYLGFQSNAVLTITNIAAFTNGGSLQFSSSNYTALQNDGSATITVERTGGSIGVVQVDYTTVPGGTAVAGEDYATNSGTLSWADGVTNSKTFDIVLLNNQQTGTNKTIFLALSNAIGGAFLGAQSNAVLTVTNTAPLPSAYAVWKSNHFGTNASDPSIAGDSADPDGDGIPNLLEYAFGTDPNIAETGKPVIGTAVSNQFQLQFYRNISATDLTYTAQATFGFGGQWSNLVTFLPGTGWQTNAPGSTVTESEPTGSPPDDHVQVIIADPVDPASTNRFFQLKIQQ